VHVGLDAGFQAQLLVLRHSSWSVMLAQLAPLEQFAIPFPVDRRSQTEYITLPLVKLQYGLLKSAAGSAPAKSYMFCFWQQGT
jgi:hypothetical protein